MIGNMGILRDRTPLIESQHVHDVKAVDVLTEIEEGEGKTANDGSVLPKAAREKSSRSQKFALLPKRNGYEAGHSNDEHRDEVRVRPTSLGGKCQGDQDERECCTDQDQTEEVKFDPDGLGHFPPGLSLEWRSGHDAAHGSSPLVDDQR